jgi:hypothetical protein
MGEADIQQLISTHGCRAGVGGLGWFSAKEIEVWAVGAGLSAGVSAGFLCFSDPLRDSHDQFVVNVKICNVDK